MQWNPDFRRNILPAGIIPEHLEKVNDFHLPIVVNLFLHEVVKCLPFLAIISHQQIRSLQRMVAERTQGTNPVAALLFDADKIAYWSQVMG
ncbi:hypothetical protein ES707_20589 [subsurface metagenome]